MKKHFSTTIKTGARFLIAACVPGSALAVDFVFVPRIGGGIVNYNINWDADALLADGQREKTKVFDLSDTMPFGMIGGTLAVEDWYLDLQYKGSDIGTDHNQTRHAFGGTRYKNRFDLNDVNVTIGYRITDNLQAFAGWMNRKTNIQQTGGTENNDYSFKSDGWFLGGSYGWFVGNGRLSAKAAYVRLEGDVDIKYDFGGSIYKLSASDSVSDGYSLGVNWMQPITDRLSYSLSLDGYHYNFNNFNMRHQGERTGTRQDVEETAYTFQAALVYVF